MKRFYLVLGIALCAAISSCVKDNTGENPQTEDKGITERLTTFTTMEVPVKDGKLTVVTFNGDTLCVTKTATSIIIPKTFATSKADEEIVISYVDSSNPNYAGYLSGDGVNVKMWQTIAFEDSKAGDYDYNDLVIHIRYELSSQKAGEQKLFMGIHPIAFGATKNIKLGCVVYYGETKVLDEIITQNSKEELFLNENGESSGISEMINTFKINYHANVFTKVISLDANNVRFGDIKVVWFIEIENGIRLYSVNERYPYLDANKRPYGLIISNTGKPWLIPNLDNVSTQHWFEYPTELLNISDCYNDSEHLGFNSFDAWLTGSTKEWNMRNPKNVFDITQEYNGKLVYEIAQSNDTPSRGDYNNVTKHYDIPKYK